MWPCVVTPIFGVRGRGQKVGLFSCNFAELFFEVFATLDFFLGAPRRLYARVVVVRNLDFLLFSTFDRSVTGTANHETVLSFYFFAPFDTVSRR